jgi:hypothetical protein
MSRRVHIGHTDSDTCGGLCGRGSQKCERDIVVNEECFEGWPREERCTYCEANWFPKGQPDWHWSIANACLLQRDRSFCSRMA